MAEVEGDSLQTISSLIQAAQTDEDHIVSNSVRCRYCLSPIERSARICSKCRSYQGRLLGWFSYFASGLTILNTISIIFVIIGVLAPWYKNNVNLKAELNIYPLYSDGAYIDYVVTNSGNRSASPVQTSVAYKLPVPEHTIIMASNLKTDFSGVVISPGATMRFRSVIQLGELPRMPNPGVELEDKNVKHLVKDCYIDVVYVDFDGEQRKVSQRYGCLYQ
jgi:hypothetical protein